MEVSSLELGIGLALIAILIAGTILFLKYRLHAGSEADLRGEHSQADLRSGIGSRAKYPSVDGFKFSGPLMLMGLAVAMGVTLLTISWTQYEKPVYIPDDALLIDETIDIEPPRTAEPPPPPPPPPPPVIEEVPEEEILEEEQPEFLDQTVEEETIIEERPPEPKPAPPPPPPPKDEPEEIFKVVEQMPRFPGCEDAGGSNDEKYQCAQAKLLEYIYKNVKYPAIARENGIQGRVVVQFVVEKDGKITDATVVRDIGAGCGEEALRVVNSMNGMNTRWTPGKQRGQPVRVQFTLPVSFKLQ
jgi:protein TonB